MNGQDRNELNLLKGEVKEIHTTVEQIKTNDLPHIDMKAEAAAGMAHEACVLASRNAGKLWAVGIILGVLIALVVGLYFIG